MAQNTISLEQIVTDFVFSMDSDDFANNASDTVVRNLALRGIREMGFDILSVSRQLTLLSVPQTP